MPKINPTCAANMTQAQKNLIAWQINWVVGREYYRSHQDMVGVAFLDGTAWVAFYPSPNPNFTDNNPNLSAYRTQVKPGFDVNVPGWDNTTCSLDLRDLACVAYWLARPETDPLRAQFVAMMQKYDADIPMLQPFCPAEIFDLPEYQPEYWAQLPPAPGPGDVIPPTPINPLPVCKPDGSVCAVAGECCQDLVCENGKCNHAKGVEFPPLEGCPAGTVMDVNSGICVKSSGVTPVKADDTGDVKKTNWWLWGSVATLVVGGAALIGFARDPEYVYEAPAAPNPTAGGPYLIEVKTYDQYLWRHYQGDISSIKKAENLINNMRKSAQKMINERWGPSKSWESELRLIADGHAEVRVLDRLRREIWHADQVPMGTSKAKKNPFGKPGSDRTTWPMLGSVTVHQLGTNNEFEYSGITPEAAVIAAYAQSLGDNNTWDYKKKYSHLLKRRGRTINIGDFAAVG
jgi:hypothetical protein